MVAAPRVPGTVTRMAMTDDAGTPITDWLRDGPSILDTEDLDRLVEAAETIDALRAELAAAQRRCEVYAAGVIAVAIYEGEFGLGFESPKRMAAQTLVRIEALTQDEALDLDQGSSAACGDGSAGA